MLVFLREVNEKVNEDMVPLKRKEENSTKRNENQQNQTHENRQKEKNANWQNEINVCRNRKMQGVCTVLSDNPKIQVAVRLRRVKGWGRGGATSLYPKVPLRWQPDEPSYH